MVNKKPVHHVIYRNMFKRSAQDDPSSWSNLVQELVSELRREVLSFYGSEGTEHERHYPGFDYTNPKIRLRLSRWPYHNKLFKAFDLLDLSNVEIESVCVWWGTLKGRLVYAAE